MIKFNNVTKNFINNKVATLALDNISFNISSNDSVTLLKGSSGSGKSTVLSLLAGLSKPTFGEIIVNDKKIAKLHDNFLSQYRRETIGFIFQKFNLISGMNVFDNIIVPLIPLNLKVKDINERVDNILELLEITDKKSIIIDKLSGGEQQRVAIARSLVNNPSILIADEPTANLDKKLSLNFINIIEMLKSKDKNIIISTHDPLFFDLDFIDKSITLDKGRLV